MIHSSRLYFEKAAKTYDRYNSVQEDIFTELIAGMSEQSFDHIVDLGCGSGRLTQLLYDTFKPTSLVGIDQSQAMIAEANRSNTIQALSFLQDDVVNVCLDPTVDLVFSNACFQWVSELNSLFASFQQPHSTHQRFVCFSVFLPGTFIELEQALSSIFNRPITLPSSRFNSQNYYHLLLKRYFKRVKTTSFNLKKTFSSLKDLLQWIKHLGIRGEGSTPAIHWTPSTLRDVERLYLKQHHRISATFNIACFWAK